MKHPTTTCVPAQEDFFTVRPERFHINLYAVADGEDWRIDGLQYCLEEQERLGFIRILVMDGYSATVDVYDPEHLAFFQSFEMGNA